MRASIHGFSGPMSTCSRRWPVSLEHDPFPSGGLAAFVVAEQARGGAVQMALARRRCPGVATEPADGDVGTAGRRAAAAPAGPVAAARARPTGPLGRGGMPPAGPPCGRPCGRWTASWRGDQRLHEAFPRYAELAAPAPIEVPAVQALLHPDEALVSWFTLPDRVLVWLVRPGQAPVYRDVPVAKAV